VYKNAANTFLNFLFDKIMLSYLYCNISVHRGFAYIGDLIIGETKGNIRYFIDGFVSEVP